MIKKQTLSFSATEYKIWLTKLLVLSVTMILTTIISAQNDSIEIRQSISQLFDGMRRFDSTMIKMVLADDVVLKTVAENTQGETIIKTESVSAFIQMVGTPQSGVTYDERIISMDIKIDQKMASVWAPYRFYLNQALHHCGVNVFTMAKLKNTWTIISITDTRKKVDCGD
ncbi:MAG: hypothetical protein WBO36_15345 [Saprospiraceae bacterium]